MKLKTDFVTNSSSSSFIVVFDKKITKFGDIEHLIPEERKMRQVFADATCQRPIKITNNNKALERIATELSYGYIDEMNSYSDYQEDFCKREEITVQEMYDNRAWIQAFYDEHAILQTRLCKKKAIEFTEQNDGKYIYIFNYGDDSGLFFGEMEHGGTFRLLPHIRVNKH